MFPDPVAEKLAFCPGIAFPYWSLTVMVTVMVVTPSPFAVPEFALIEDCATLIAAGEIVIGLESTVRTPEPEVAAFVARIVGVPATVMYSPEPAKFATPLTADRLVVPEIVPDPPLTLREICAPASAPVVTTFPFASSIVTMPCGLHATPAVPPEG